MRKLVLKLLTVVLFSAFQLQAVDFYFTSAAKSDKATAIKLSQTADGDAITFEKVGPFGNFVLKAGANGVDNFGGYLRVDNDDRQLYSVSKISPSSPVDVTQASYFQIVFLTDYEIKLFKMRLSTDDKTKLTVDDATVKTKVAGVLEAYSDMTKEPLTLEQTTLLVSEFSYLVKFITQGTDDSVDKVAYTTFVKNHGANVDSLILEIQKLNKSPDAAQLFLNAVKSWDFGYASTVVGSPANNDLVVIFSQATQQYFSVVKDKGLDGSDVYYVAATASDPISASQFKVEEVGGRVGFVCQSDLGMGLAMIAPTPTFDSDVASVKRKLSRLLLTARGDKAFGQPGTEAEQFQLSGVVDNFLLKNAGVDAADTGFLTVENDDLQILHVFDYEKTPIGKKNDNTQQFKFIIVSNAKPFYDALFKARAEKNNATRLGVYVQLLTTVSSVQNAKILLGEVKKMMLDNKTTEQLWESFTSNFTTGISAFIDQFNTAFTQDLAGNADLTAVRDDVVKTLAAPFVETLENGNYAIAWVDKNGVKNFLTMVTEDNDKPENYNLAFKINATGTDPLNPASIFGLELDLTSSSIQFSSEFQKDQVLGTGNFVGPNEALAQGEGSYSKIKIGDETKGSTTKYLRMYAWRAFSDQAQKIPQDETAFQFTYEGSSQSMNFKSVQTTGYLVVNPTDFSLHSLDDSDNPIAAPGDNGTFVLVRVTDQQMEMANIRSKTIKEQIAFYSTQANTFDGKSAKDVREAFVDEVSKFVGRVVSTASNFSDAKANSTQMDLLMAAINDPKKVATYKTIADKANAIRTTWQTGFSGAFEADQWYALSFKDASGAEKISKVTKLQDKDEYTLGFVAKAGAQDELDPMSDFRAEVDANGVVSLYITITGKDYTLSVNDDFVAQKRNGLSFKLVPTLTDAEQFDPVKNDDGSVSLKSRKMASVKNADGTVSPAASYGFITIDSADADDLGNRGASTLSELTNAAAGMKDSNGNLVPSDYGKFQKTELSAIHKQLSGFRSLDNLARLEKYIEIANYQNLTAVQNQAIAAEVVAWVTQLSQDKATYDTLHSTDNKAFTPKLTTLLSKVKGSLSQDSAERPLIDGVKDTWLGGFVGTKSTLMPEAGKTLLLMVDLKFTDTDAVASYFLRAMQDDEYEKIILRADSLSQSPMDDNCLLEVMLNGGRIGFKSNANDGAILMHTVDATAKQDLMEAAPRAKETALSLSFADAATANFESKTPTGSQFVLDSSATTLTAVQLKELSTQGIVNILVDINTSTGIPVAVARVVDTKSAQLTGYTAAGQNPLSIVPTNAVYDGAIAAIKEADATKQVAAFKTLINKVKPGGSGQPPTPDKLFFTYGLDKAFRGKQDMTLYNQVLALITTVKTQWQLKDNDAQLGVMNDVLASMFIMGQNYAAMIVTSAKAVVASGKDRDTQLKQFVTNQLSNWQKALIDNWSDATIQAALNLDPTDSNTPIKILSERISAFEKIVTDALPDLLKLDKSDASGIKKITADFNKQKGLLEKQRRDLVNKNNLQQAAAATAATPVVTTAVTKSGPTR
jgi:hypothetical protein